MKNFIIIIMENNYIIKILNSDDWEITKSISLESLRDSPQAFGSNYEKNLEYDEAKWRLYSNPITSGSHANTVVAFDENGQAVGKAILIIRSEDKAEIAGMYVNPKHRGQGLGRKLIEKAIESIPEGIGIKILEMSVNPIQTPAYKLYESMGFKEVKRESMLLGDGKEYDVITLQKPFI
jgi:ribosomal protein S18 acetylase RimI-like enzyme